MDFFGKIRQGESKLIDKILSYCVNQISEGVNYELDYEITAELIREGILLSEEENQYWWCRWKEEERLDIPYQSKVCYRFATLLGKATRGYFSDSLVFLDERSAACSIVGIVREFRESEPEKWENTLIFTTCHTPYIFVEYAYVLTELVRKEENHKALSIILDHLQPRKGSKNIIGSEALLSCLPSLPIFTKILDVADHNWANLPVGLLLARKREYVDILREKHPEAFVRERGL